MQTCKVTITKCSTLWRLANLVSLFPQSMPNWIQPSPHNLIKWFEKPILHSQISALTLFIFLISFKHTPMTSTNTHAWVVLKLLWNISKRLREIERHRLWPIEENTNKCNTIKRIENSDYERFSWSLWNRVTVANGEVGAYFDGDLV